MTLRLLARGSLLFTAANLIPRLGAFLLLPFVTRVLGQSDFGTVSLAASGAFLLGIALRLGVDMALLRLHFDVDDRDRRDLYGTAAVISAVAAALAVGVGALVIGSLVPGVAATVALLALATGALSTFQYLPSVWLRATERPMSYLLLSGVSFAASAVGTVVLVIAIQLGAAGAVAAQLLGVAIPAVAAVALIRRLGAWRVRPELARRALGFGLPLLPYALGGWLLNVSDRWLLGMLLGLPGSETLASVGIYSLGYQLGYAVGLAAISFNAAWLPLFYRLGEGPDGPALLRAMTTVALAAATVLAVLAAALAPELVLLMAGPEWRTASDVAAVVAFASVANAAGLMLAGVLFLARRTLVVPMLTLAAAAANVVANLLLIPELGIMGAAWASLLGYAVLAALSWLAARRHYPVGLEWRRLGGMVAVGVGAVVVAHGTGPAGGSLAGGAWHLLLGLAGAAVIVLVARPRVAVLRQLLRAPEAVAGGAAAVG